MIKKIAILFIIFFNSFLAISQCNVTLNQSGSISCYGGNDGFINVAAAGVAPLKYFINGTPNGTNVFNTLKSGTYKILMLDNSGCKDSVIVTLTQPDSIKFDLTPTPPKCFGDKNGNIAAVNVVGGNGGYTYFWNTTPINQTTATATNIGANSYTLTVRDPKGCNNSKTITLGEPTQLIVDVVGTNVSCFGLSDGSATATITGGTTPYTFNWTNPASVNLNITNLSANTYIANATDKNNCKASKSITINAPIDISLSFTNENPSCFGKKDGNFEVFTSGGTPLIVGGKATYNYTWSHSPVNTNLFTDLPGGLYNVTVKDKNNCSKSLSITLTDPTKLILKPSGVNPKCYNSSDGSVKVSTSGGFAPYFFVWSANNVKDSVVSGLTSGNYTVLVSDKFGCTDTSSINLINPLPISTVTTPISPLCAGTATGKAAIKVTNGGVAPYIYTWSPSNFIGDTLKNVAAGKYTVLIKDANNCLKRDTAIIKDPAALVIDSISIVRVSCFGSNDAKATINGKGGTGTYTYKWNDPNMQNSKTATNLAAGNYIATLTDANNCAITSPAIITQPGLLSAVSISTASNCKGEANGIAAVGPSGGTYPYKYKWNFTIKTDSIIFDVPAGSYQVTVTDKNNCSTNITVNIGEPATAVSNTLIQTVKGCYNACQSKAIVNSKDGSPPYTYNWSNNNKTNSTSNLCSSKYFVTVTDSRGCKKVDSISISPVDSISANLLGTKVSCYGLSDGRIGVNAVAGGNGGGTPANYTYTWNTTPPATTEIIQNLKGNKTYIVTIADKSGCFNTFSYKLDEPDKILINATSKTNPFCNGSSEGSILVNASGGTGGFGYQWSPNVITGNSTNNPLNLKAGNYTVTVTDQTNCKSDTSFTLTQPTAVALNIADITNNKCAGDSTGSIKISGKDGTGPYNFNWSTSPKDTLSSISKLPNGKYQYTITDKNGCKFSDTLVVNSPLPLIVNSTSTGITCFGGNDGSINISYFGGVSPYTFSLDGKKYNGIQNLVGLYAGDYDIFVKDANGCVASNFTSIYNPPKLEVEVFSDSFFNSKDTTILLGDSIKLFPKVKNQTPPVSYVWNEPVLGQLNCLKCDYPFAKPNYSALYYLTAIDSKGCRAKSSITINVRKDNKVVFPTGFTPNNDGNNEIFYPRGKDSIKVADFRIYDRWGELVFQSGGFKMNEKIGGWDGTFRGQEMISSVYVWVCEVIYPDYTTEIFRGQVTLIR
jgi:gliding motility-associated-like protein